MSNVNIWDEEREDSVLRYRSRRSSFPSPTGKAPRERQKYINQSSKPGITPLQEKPYASSQVRASGDL